MSRELVYVSQVFTKLISTVPTTQVLLTKFWVKLRKVQYNIPHVLYLLLSWDWITANFLATLGNMWRRSKSLGYLGPVGIRATAAGFGPRTYRELMLCISWIHHYGLNRVNYDHCRVKWTRQMSHLEKGEDNSKLKLKKNWYPSLWTNEKLLCGYLGILSPYKAFNMGYLCSFRGFWQCFVQTHDNFCQFTVKRLVFG